MRFDVTILGNSSASPVYDRNPSSQVVNINDRLFLVDCGEGTQHRLLKYGIKYQRIEHIFISHLHGDHYFGLIGLLSSMSLNGRVRPVHIYAQAPLKEIIDLQIKHGGGDLRFPIHFHTIDPSRSELIYEDEEMEVTTIVLEHRVACTGFLFKKISRGRKINKDKVDQLNIPVDYFPLLKQGVDYQDMSGRFYPVEELTFEPEPPKTYAYVSDTKYSNSYLDLVRKVDLLYHEATFLHDLKERAEETMHSTALQAAILAKDAQVGKLIIGHFSARYRDLSPLLEEARSCFVATELAEEGKTFEI